MPQRLNKKQGYELLSKGNPELRNDLRWPYSMSNLFLFGDGSLLIEAESENYYVLYETVDAYLNVIKPKGNLGRSHILSGFPPTEKKFLLLIEEGKKSLEKELNIFLDYSMASLQIIDNALYNKHVTYYQYNQVFFKLIVPYVYQTIVKSFNAEMFFVFNNEYQIAEPFLRLNNGREINIFVDLWEEAHENFSSFSVYSTSLLRIKSL